jgi:CheY-like chemotaxis protein
MATGARRFHGLMPYRIREVLLVSRPYDAFILEEDGLLTEQLYLEFLDIAQPSAPRFTHAATGAEALERMEHRRFDMVLSLTNLPDMEPNELAQAVKEKRPGRPVILLALDRKELQEMWGGLDLQALDGAFLWSGDPKILLAIIKYVEDRENVDHDIEHGDVRVIVILEDSPRYYSSFLAILYKELMMQSRSLYAEGVDEISRQLFIKSRPKILHAVSYEEGVELFERYRRNVMAAICDLRLPRGGELDDAAGLDFALHARSYDPELPVLLQSSFGLGARRAAAMGASFIDKASPTLLAEVREFLRQRLGFGDFVFRCSDGGEEVARARDLRELELALATVPEEAIVYHAAHNHFSIWLQARSEFEGAEKLRPRKVADFPDVAATRAHIIGLLRVIQRRASQGVVADYSRAHLHENPFCRFGSGSLGGKARGLAFLHRRLARALPRGLGGLELAIPQTVVLTTGNFDRFLDENDLRDFALHSHDDREIEERFLEAPLPEDLREELAYLAAAFDGPLAARSSSLLEDSLHEGLAGIYTTVMVPNCDPDPETRLQDVCDAIRLVWASTFCRNARRFLESTGHLIEEEKMAVILQRVVGREHDGRFYPSFSGVALSRNHYPFGPQRPEEGVVHLALGLGRTIVEGGLSLRFSPAHPQVLPQLATPRAMLRSSQKGFFAVDMDGERQGRVGEWDPVRWFDLEAAEADGTLAAVGSVLSAEDQQVRDDLSLPGPRVVTFNNLLKHRAIPLAEAVGSLLEVAREALGYEVELELACDLCDLGRRRRRRGGKRAPPRLYLLQVRPMADEVRSPEASGLAFRRRDSLCVSRHSLGNGFYQGISDLVYVRRDTWEARHHRAIAREIGKLNERLRAEERPYVLIGPGRWGTADPWLGIPVEWSQISSVRVLVEASPDGYHVEPSQGAHFFQNMTSLGIGYLTVPPGADGAAKGEELLDWEWLEAQEPAAETRFLRHLRFPEPLSIVLSGPESRGVIAKPGARPR